MFLLLFEMKDDTLDVFTLIKSLGALSISYSGPHAPSDEEGNTTNRKASPSC